MPLIDLLNQNPTRIYSLSLRQIVTLCGDGKLRDETEASREFRAFLRQCPSGKFSQYVEVCLQRDVEDNGYILQDLVNELGRRLDYEVQNGRYQGKTGLIGYDGLWKLRDGRSIILEVKTTDAYRINLDTIANYREKLLEADLIGRTSSILIVVGRQDTGDLEAQVRGSRHAWDVRLISVDALIKLVQLREDAEEDTVDKIREVLTPFEYTRVDRIIDIAFTAAKDVETAIQLETAGQRPDEIEATTEPEHQVTPPSQIEGTREALLARLSAREGIALVKTSRALYRSVDGEKARVACTISKRYARGLHYWYAYHPAWDKFLESAEKGYFVLGCADQAAGIAIPREWIAALLPELNTSGGSTDKQYWHIHLVDDEEGRFQLIKSGGDRVSVDHFKI